MDKHYYRLLHQYFNLISKLSLNVLLFEECKEAKNSNTTVWINTLQEIAEQEQLILNDTIENLSTIVETNYDTI